MITSERKLLKKHPALRKTVFQLHLFTVSKYKIHESNRRFPIATKIQNAYRDPDHLKNIVGLQPSQDQEGEAHVKIP